ncbi:hypothetical protein ACP70R_001446 [Stipagrostis hirtigluma subsp. patula]
MEAATARQPPGFFSFLGHGASLPARNRGLFLPLLVVTAALAAALLLGNALAVQPLAAAVLADADAISRADPASAAYRELARSLRADVRRFLLAAGSCLLVAVLAGSAIKIATVFAAVAALSGAERRATVGAALGAAKGNVWGPVPTVAFGYALELACAGGIVAMALLAVVLLEYSLLLLFLDALLVLLASLFLVYLTVVCAVAVVVSAAEPGRRGAAAVSRAWRLMRGKNAQAVLYVVATCALAAAVSPVYTAGDVPGAGEQEPLVAPREVLEQRGRVGDGDVVVSSCDAVEVSVGGGGEGRQDEELKLPEHHGEDDAEGEDLQEEAAPARRDDDAVLQEGEDARRRFGRGGRHWYYLD